MPSYTQLAGAMETQSVLPPAVLTNADAAEAWIERLPANIRDALKAKLARLALSLPEPVKLDLQRKIAKHGEAPPVPLEGLGQWGALATGLSTLASTGIQIGLNIYQGKEQADLQKDLASQSAATQTQIEQIRATAALEAARLMAEAQVAAAQQAAQSGAASTGKVATVAVVGVLALAAGAYFVLRKKRK